MPRRTLLLLSVIVASAVLSGCDSSPGPKPGEMTGVIWQDTNADGYKDASEPPLTGNSVVIAIYDAAATIPGDAPLDSTTPDQEGGFRLDILPPGQDVKVHASGGTLPAGGITIGPINGIEANRKGLHVVIPVP